jgi:hypothetical protein
LTVAGLLVLGVAACGGDGDGDAGVTTLPPVATSTEAPPPAPELTEPTEPGEREGEETFDNTPESLADCLRGSPGIGDVLVKGGDSEDAVFFSELVGGRVHVLAVSYEGDTAELTIALFESAAAARKAVSGAGGAGQTARAEGLAVVISSPGADSSVITDCLRLTGYTS